ncbi:MAG: cysteine-rich small domain-containing protein [Candidatus Ventricola sp.]
MDDLKSGSRYFENRDCAYFPCHKGMEGINCLFCYCPLYALGRACGGSFIYDEQGVKDCSGCTFPHRRENYDRVIARYGEILEVVRREDARNHQG